MQDSLPLLSGSYYLAVRAVRGRNVEVDRLKPLQLHGSSAAGLWFDRRSTGSHEQPLLASWICYEPHCHLRRRRQSHHGALSGTRRYYDVEFFVILLW